MTRILGLKEVPGVKDNPFILWCLTTCNIPEPLHDEIPWCSALLNGVFFLLGIPRSGSAAARSWAKVGKSIPLEEAQAGFDIVILGRGEEPFPPLTYMNPDGSYPPGHVGLFGGWNSPMVDILGGNQGDRISLAPFPFSHILDVRRPI